MMDYRTDYRREPADYRRVINENSAPEALRDYRRDGVATSGDGVALSTTTAIVSCAAISVAAFGYCLAQGATGPCVAELLLERACLSHNLTYPSKACTSSVTSQDTASRRLSYYNLCCQLPALMTVAGVAMIADSRGRKVAALVPYTGSMLATLALAVLPAAAPVCVGGTCVDSFTALLCTTAIASASGGYFSVLAFSFAVIGDATERASSPKLRTYLFAVLETALMVGFFAGPAIGGELGPLLGLQHSLFVPVACYLVGLVTILCLMTETLEQEKRATFSWAKANPFGAMAMLLDNRIATTLASCVLLSNMAGGAGTVLPLYLAQTLGYDSVQTGWFTASGQAGAAVGLLVVLPALQRCISTKAIVVISVGMSVLSGFGGGLGVAAMGYGTWASEEGLTWTPYVMQGMGGVLTIIWYPCMRATMTKQFGDTSFAMAIGAISTLQTACGVVGSLVFAQLYARTEAHMPPLIYFINAAMNLAAVLLAITLPNLDDDEAPDVDLHDTVVVKRSQLRAPERRLYEHVERSYKKGDAEGDLLKDALLTASAGTRRV